MESAVVKLEKISSDTEYSPTKKSKSKNKKSVTKSPKGGNKTAAAAPKQKTYSSKAAAKQRGMIIFSFEHWARISYFIVLRRLCLLPCFLTCMAKNNSVLFST